MTIYYYVYILTTSNYTTIYIGITKNIDPQIHEHKRKIIKGFTAKYNCTKLIHFEKHLTPPEAINREKQVKNWKREWKLNLVRKENPDFKDLSKSWN